MLWTGFIVLVWVQRTGFEPNQANIFTFNNMGRQIKRLQTGLTPFNIFTMNTVYIITLGVSALCLGKMYYISLGFIPLVSDHI